MKMLLTLVTALIVSFMFFSFTPGLPGNASEDEDIQKLIGTAATPEDHIKIAEYLKSRP